MKKIIFSALLCLGLINFSANANKYSLKLKSGTVTLDQQDQSKNLSKFSEKHQTKYAIIQFFEIPTQKDKNQLKSNGIELLEYLPNNSFISFIDQVSKLPLSELNIRAAVPFLPKYKFSKALNNDNDMPIWADAGNGQVKLMIEPHLNIGKEAFSAFLSEKQLELLNEDPSGSFYEISIAKEKIEEFANFEVVKYLDYIPAPPEKEDLRARGLHRSNMLDSDHPMGRKYNGDGVSLAIADDGTIGPHIDIKGRVTQLTNVDNGGTHGDMTSGIAIGAGNLNPIVTGTATAASLFYYFINGYPHIANAVTNLNTRGVVVTSTSFSEGCNAGYISTTRTVDQQTRQNPELLHVFSAGNSAGSTCGSNAYGAGIPWGTITGGRKQGKAAIAVANVDYTGVLDGSSSRGPAADGRIKPDISAHGRSQLSTAPNNTFQFGGGTSASAPSIAGVAVQLYHGYRELNNGNDPESALIKSAMLNSARDVGNKGPDFTFGWGIVNAHRAIKIIEENRFLDSTISQGDTNSHSISISNDLEELRLMVYWTDFEASTIAATALVNNLDIKVVTPSNDTIFPWLLDHRPIASNLNTAAGRGIDSVNNVEQVAIDSAVAGTYKVIVNGTSVPQGPQKYFLSWETKSDEIEVTYPYGGESFIPGQTETIRWDATGDQGGFLLDFSVDSGSTWSSIGGFAASGSARHRDWVVPNNISGDALVRVRRVTSGGTPVNGDTSDFTFNIMEVTSNISETFVCFDSIGIQWDSIPGATSYTIYKLGDKFMDSIGTSNTTSFVLDSIDKNDDIWVAIQGTANDLKGRRSNAFQLSKIISDCPFEYDLSLDSMISPNDDYMIGCNLSKIAVKVQITNFGDSSFSNVPLDYTVNGVTFRDTLKNTLQADSSITFTFKDSITLVSNSFNTFSLNSSLPLDENFENDFINNNFRVLPGNTGNIPDTMNFDQLNACSTQGNCGVTICNLGNKWTNLTNGTFDDVDLRINSGGTGSQTTGPFSDLSGSGNYLYFEATSCFENTADVISPCYDLSNVVQPELEFFYHMNGLDMGTLSVDIFQEGNWDKGVALFSGTQGNIWRRQRVDLSKYDGKTITIRFRATSGSGFRSDMAIDGIRITGQPVGLEEPPQVESGFSIFPNPSKGLVNIELNQTANQDILIYDLNGRIVKRIRPTAITFSMDLSSLEKGIYFIALEDNSIKEKLVLF